MERVTLGRTNITVQKNGFGGLPIQRIPEKDAVHLLRKAFEHGINFYDTARFYLDSEHKIGVAFEHDRDKIYIASKTMARTPDLIKKELEISLEQLRTDYIDVYQLHMSPCCYRPGDGTGVYETLQELKDKGKIRHIGITAHLLNVAREAVESELYDTLQYPFCYISGEAEAQLVERCAEKNIGFIAMKAMSGGLITNSAAAYAFLAQYPQVLPIWGIQKESELDEFISYIGEPPIMNDKIRLAIEKDRKELAGEFCRGCGYCMPCPVGIEINNSARISLLMRRSFYKSYLSEEWQQKMKRVEDCINCGQCTKKCPYSLDTPALLKKHYEDYKKVLSGEVCLD